MSEQEAQYVDALSHELEITSWLECANILDPDDESPTLSANRLASRGRVGGQKVYHPQANQSILAGLELGASQCLNWVLWKYMAYPATS